METKNKKGERKRTRSQDQNTSEIAKLLPDEIIFIILSKLPITSVLQCRCVCKSWLAIIRDPQFADAHLAFAQSTGTDPSIILWSRTSGIPNKMYLVEPNTFKIFNEITWIPKVCDAHKIPSFHVVGSCNGLICLARSHDSVPVYVCNPLTMQSMALPPSTHRATGSAVFGLGFTLNTKEYKVVRILPIKVNHFTGVGTSRVEVYTLGTGYWRSKGILPYWLGPNDYFNTFVNGALHWFTGYSINRSLIPNQVIVSFDVGDEQFRLIPHPDFDPKVTVCRFVGVTEGCLSLHNYSRRGYIDIWIMKDYGVKDSWSKFFVFSEDHHFFYPLNTCRNDKPILGYRPEDISGSGSRKLVIKDVGSKRLTELQLHGVPKIDLVYSHVASLITLESACGGEKMSKRERMEIKQRMMSGHVSTRSRSGSRCNKM